MHGLDVGVLPVRDDDPLTAIITDRDTVIRCTAPVPGHDTR
jgi:hypothetical protein